MYPLWWIRNEIIKLELSNNYLCVLCLSREERYAFGQWLDTVGMDIPDKLGEPLLVSLYLNHSDSDGVLETSCTLYSQVGRITAAKQKTFVRG